MAGSVGAAVSLAGLLAKVSDSRRSRKQLRDVQDQKRALRHDIRAVEEQIRCLDRLYGSNHTRGIRRETVSLVVHAKEQIRKFERFYKKFEGFRARRFLYYAAEGAMGDKIRKYAGRFETYTNWLAISWLCISL